MSSYLDYNNNDEDDKCLVNIFGRYSDSSSSTTSENEKRELNAEITNEKGEIDGKSEQVEHNSLTYYQLSHQNNQIEIETNKIKGIAHQLWPASYLLCNYLQEHFFELIANPSQTDVIELGAGVGLSGIVLGTLGCNSVTITDLPEALPLINTNIQRNQHLFPSQTTVQSNILQWGNIDNYHNCYQCLSSSLTHQTNHLIIIAADCVYWEHLYEPFFHTLHYFIDHHNATIILSHYKRWKKEKKFFTMCQKKFHVEIIYENIENILRTDQYLDFSSVVTTGGSDECEENNNQRIRQKQISRIYRMKRKES